MVVKYGQLTVQIRRKWLDVSVLIFDPFFILLFSNGILKNMYNSIFCISIMTLLF